MEDTVTTEEEDADSRDFSLPTDHGHLTWNSLVKIKISIGDFKEGQKTPKQY